jgi:anti-anti-sigma factor
VDLATAPVLEDHIIRRLAAGPSILVIDLTEVTFLGSSGLAVLVKARDQAGLRTLVRVVANSQVTLRPLRITALDRLLAVCPSVEHAVADPLDGPSQVRPAPARTADVVG